LKVLLSAPDQKKYSGLRDYVLMKLLLDAFLRINDAISLRIEDVDLIGVGPHTHQAKIFEYPQNEKSYPLFTKRIAFFRFEGYINFLA
jgi:integrase